MTGNTLAEVMRACNNWFIVTSFYGDFKIAEGHIVFPFGITSNYNYYKIQGSAENDGIHSTTEILIDETFIGSIMLLNVPKELLLLVNDIETFQEKYGESCTSPFQSESFGGYSYTKATNANGGAYTWRDAFKDRLRMWRKL